MAVAPGEFPPLVNAAEEFVGPPTDAPDDRIEVGIAIVGGGPAGLACAIRTMQLLENEPELAEIPLLWMVERARAAGLAFRADHFQPPAHGVDDERRRLGEEVAPDALGTIHESLDGIFLLAWRHPRPLIDVDGGAVASSALRRLEGLPGYKPPELTAYLAAGGDEIDVPEGAWRASGQRPRGPEDLA